MLGFNVSDLLGAAAPMVGILLPSTHGGHTLGSQQPRARGPRAFTVGIASQRSGPMIATGWLLAALAMIVATVMLTIRTKIGIVWMVLASGVLGALGVV
ncbi:hypothetical protein ACFJIX_17780 [Roseateles sp. UC29_93]|uniref:hypothetical protein n=1 Tax=Roseateles sp. UC29_93 TaxID=3350177 RepID=UPI003670EDB6